METAEQPNPADFTKDEKPGEYEVRFRVTGRISMPFVAESKEDAMAQAEKMMDDETFGLDLDAVDDVHVDYIYKSPAMYRVVRNGVKMQVSHLQPGDKPRDPEDRGF